MAVGADEQITTCYDQQVGIVKWTGPGAAAARRVPPTDRQDTVRSRLEARPLRLELGSLSTQLFCGLHKVTNIGHNTPIPLNSLAFRRVLLLSNYISLQLNI